MNVSPRPQTLAQSKSAASLYREKRKASASADRDKIGSVYANTSKEVDEIDLLNRSFGTLRDFNSVGQHIVNKYTKTTNKPKDPNKSLSLDDLYNLGQALV